MPTENMFTGPGTTKGITYEKINQISNHFILIGSGPLNIIRARSHQAFALDMFLFDVYQHSASLHVDAKYIANAVLILHNFMCLYPFTLRSGNI